MSEDFARRYAMMQQYVGWTEEDARRVAALRPLVEPRAPDLVADFYAEIRRHPEAMRVIVGGSEQMARLSRSLHAWLAELLAGPHDDAYMTRRWRVGHRHVEIGLAQRYVALALARLRNGIAECIVDRWTGAPRDLQGSLASLHKLLDLEHALIEDAYEYEFNRRERELERQRSERRFRHLVENASCLIAILTADKTVAYFNPYAEKTIGYSVADLAREPRKVLGVLGSDLQRTEAQLDAVLRGIAVPPYEALIQGRSGSPCWIHWTLSRIDDSEGGSAVLAVGHDVTPAKRSAEQLLQASRLATIGEMYAGLAHESRNALQRLRTCTDMLDEAVADRPDAKGFVDRSRRAQDDLQRLLDEVRSFAAPIVLEPTDCRISTLWRESWSYLQLQRRGRRAEFVDDGCDPAMVVHGDRFRLVQAFRNILENALAACPDPVTIRLHCREADLDGAPAVEMSIVDNGPGFAEASLHRAFEPFFTTKSSGTGLGLAIVRRTIEAHGGRAAALRAEGGGAKIVLVLPRAAATVVGEKPSVS